MATFLTHHSVMDKKSLQKPVQELNEQLLKDEISEDEYFCMILSLLGQENTQVSFMKIIQEFRVEHEKLHKHLSDIYTTYFSQFELADIPAPMCEMDEEMDLELAIQLSLQENPLDQAERAPGLGTAGNFMSSQGFEQAEQKVHAGATPSLSIQNQQKGNRKQKSFVLNVGKKNDFGDVRGDITFVKGAGNQVKKETKGLNHDALMDKVRAMKVESEPLQSEPLNFGDRPGPRRTPLRLRCLTGAWSGSTPKSMNQPMNTTSKYKFTPTESKASQNQDQQSTSLKFIGNNGKKKKDTASKSPATVQISSSRGVPVGMCNGIERPLLNKPVVLWFRRDLRIYDNPGLVEACSLGGPVIPVFLWSEEEEGPLAAGGATKVWLHHALKCLNQSLLDRYGSHLIFRKTKFCKQELLTIVQMCKAKTVIWNDLYEPYLKQRDDSICNSLEKKAIVVKRFHSYCLRNPYSIRTDSTGMRGIGSVSHFMHCSKRSAEEPIGYPEDPPDTIPLPSQWPDSQPLEELELDKMPRRRDGSIIDWAATMRSMWKFSEDDAYNALQNFLSDAVRRYEKESGRCDTPNTSGLSPYLHFGQISPRTVYHEGKHSKSPKFMRKLAWRDLSYWLLTLFPDMPSEPMRPHYKNLRWSYNAVHLKAWQKGKTGYPLIDAAMKELWVTGWMNNYMRHCVASFLIAYLNLHWIEGYQWFQDTLLDADVAINAMMWQNGGMTGLDHWNFVMHPVDAAMTCDPKGDYVRKWLPQLAQMPEEFIHKPWKCPPSILRRCGVELGVNYPQRIITDLEAAREQSLQDVTEVRLRYGHGWIDPHGNDMVPLPSGRKVSVITRKEFKYKTANPEAKDNPHTAVLRGYRSRKRDEAIAFANKVDFLCSTMDECVKRSERYDKFAQYDQFSSVY